MTKSHFYLIAAGFLGTALTFAPPASATISNIITTEPADAPAFIPVDPDDAVLTFIAQFDDSNSGEPHLPPDVISYLNSLGAAGVVYLGRDDGTGGTGTTVSSTGEGTSSGSWTLDPGSTGDVVSFIVLHAGNGTTYDLYQIDTPGLTGIWDTSELNAHGLSFLDLFGGSGPIIINGGGGASPEPASLSLLGAGLLGVGFLRRRMKR